MKEDIQKTIVLIIMILIISFISYNNSVLSNFVSKFGENYELFFTDLDKTAQKYFYLKKYKYVNESFNIELNEYIDIQQKFVKYYKGGTDKDPGLIHSSNRLNSKDRAIINYNNHHVDKYSKKEKSNTEYLVMGKNVDCQEIVLTKSHDASDVDIKKSKNKDVEVTTETGYCKRFNEYVKITLQIIWNQIKIDFLNI